VFKTNVTSHRKCRA